MATQGRLAGKVALVTGKISRFFTPVNYSLTHMCCAGGGSGFGLSICEVYAREGCKILIGDLNTAGAAPLAEKYPNSIILQQMNVTKREDWDAAVATVEQKLGPLNILVNNAGTSYKNKPSLTVTEKEYALCFDVNVLSIFHSVAAVFPGFVERNGGAVINISSCGASRPRQGLVWYNASKGAVSNVSFFMAPRSSK